MYVISAFSFEWNIGHVAIIGSLVLAGIAAWYKRGQDIALLTNSSESRYAANAKRLDDIDAKVQHLNESGSPASTREMDLIRSELHMLETLYADQQSRINSLEEIKPQIATLVERSSHTSNSMREIKEQLNVLVNRHNSK